MTRYIACRAGKAGNNHMRNGVSKGGWTNNAVRHLSPSTTFIGHEACNT